MPGWATLNQTPLDFPPIFYHCRESFFFLVVQAAMMLHLSGLQTCISLLNTSSVWKRSKEDVLPLRNISCNSSINHKNCFDFCKDYSLIQSYLTPIITGISTLCTGIWFIWLLLQMRLLRQLQTDIVLLYIKVHFWPEWTILSRRILWRAI